MALHKAKNVLIKLGDGATPTELFTTVANLTTANLGIEDSAEEITSKDSGQYVELFTAGAVKQYTISGSAQAETDSSQMGALFELKDSQDPSANFIFDMDSGNSGRYWQGNFFIQTLNITSEANGLTNFDFTAVSNGVVTGATGPIA